MSEEKKKKFSKCGKGEKKCKCRISGVRKKNGNWKKSSGKKIKVFFFGENLKWKILLSSYSLVGFYVNLQVKVMGKKWKFSKYLSGGVFKVKVAILLKKDKVKKNVGVVDVPLVECHVDWKIQSHGLKGKLDLNLLWQGNVLQITKKSFGCGLPR